MSREPNTRADGPGEASLKSRLKAAPCPRWGNGKALPFAFFLIALAASPLLAGEGQWHVVAQGETIYSVARSFGLSASALQAANGISDPSRLRVGQRLLIPNIHSVAKGETLFGIAKAADTTVKELRRLNGLSDSAVIHVGDILMLPSTEGRPGPAQGAKDSGSAPPSPPLAADSTNPAPTPPLAQPSAQSTSPQSSGPSAAVKAPPVPAPAPADLPATRSPPSASNAALASADLPCPGSIRYLDGKVFGIAIRSADGATVHSVTDGLVVSAGPYRGFGSVVFVQTRSGLIFVYGGNNRIEVKVGDQVRRGQTLGRVGSDAFSGATDAYFFVFKGSKALDPATAPRN